MRQLPVSSFEGTDEEQCALRRGGSASLGRKTLGKQTRGVLLSRFCMVSHPLRGGKGFAVRGWGGGVAAARPSLCLAEGFRQGPLIPGEACVRTHLSSHVPSGTQQPTEHTLVSAGRVEVEPAVSNPSWTDTIVVREVLGLPRTPKEGHVKLPTLLLQRLRGSQDMGLSSPGQTRPVGPRFADYMV